MTRRSYDFDWPGPPPPRKPTEAEHARELILSIGHALKTTHHYDLAGNELTSVSAVLVALQRDGEIRLKKKEQPR